MHKISRSRSASALRPQVVVTGTPEDVAACKLSYTPVAAVGVEIDHVAGLDDVEVVFDHQHCVAGVPGDASESPPISRGLATLPARALYLHLRR